jgi:DNA-binding response OmpR family regulator
MKILIIDENLTFGLKLKYKSEENKFKSKTISFFKEQILEEYQPDVVLINLETKTNDISKIIPLIKSKNIKIIGYCDFRKKDLALKSKQLGANFIATNTSIVHNFLEILKNFI